jgi:hypothetical protein
MGCSKDIFEEFFVCDDNIASHSNLGDITHFVLNCVPEHLTWRVHLTLMEVPTSAIDFFLVDGSDRYCAGSEKLLAAQISECKIRAITLGISSADYCVS